jgi:quercetin dioxygenase-like cupin family protein
MEIKKENCGLNFHDGNTVLRNPVLTGEIKNLNTFYLRIPENNVYHFKYQDNPGSIFLFFNGKGYINDNVKWIEVNEIALYVPSDSGEATIKAIGGELEILEVSLKYADDDLIFLGKNRGQFPCFISYSQCDEYKESIKSDKTVSRMLLPENLIPRFCMGSVETTGPDQIGEHDHPMLEQLFFGLRKNECTVKANGAEILFEENDLLHIPLGSLHGVEVTEGKFLHYIWIDYFRSQNEMKYISETHILNK